MKKYLLLCTLIVGFYQPLLYAAGSDLAKQPAQTDVDRAEYSFDHKGVPIINIKGVGEQRHPAMVAIYALAYDGVEVYDHRMENLADKNKFMACIDWLKSNLKQNQNNLWVWEYHFDNTYNDISIKAPWSSAFGQAVGIQALLAAYKQTGKSEFLDLAKKAAKSLFTPIEQGGFLYRNGDDIWFEEIPVPANNPSHILNGHMRVLLVLKELLDITHDGEVEAYFKAGMNTLYRWLPLYDTGYWLRYDLNPKKSELLFRFANPYGFKNYPLAIHKITLRDPLTNKEVTLQVGTNGDNLGNNRIAGIHWGQPEILAGKQVRRLLPIALENKTNELTPPHSYVYLALPDQWKNNLRKAWYELTIDYYDEARANITVQQRSIAPGQTFYDVRDGDLHLSGAKQWRQWIVPVRPSDLGFWVGESYADKHAKYLSKLARYDARFLRWANQAKAYLNLEKMHDVSYKNVIQKTEKLPKNLPMLSFYSLDKNGVLLENQSSDKTHFLSNGSFDPKSDVGAPQYSPFIVASQLIEGAKNQTSYFSYQSVDPKLIKRKNALFWFLSKDNQRNINNTTTYVFNFDNAYNDIFTQSPWTSAFSQAYVLKALQYAVQNNIGIKETINPLINNVANSFNADVHKGGVSSTNKENLKFFEEVPNASHVLNAHLISTNELAATSRYLQNQQVAVLSSQGIQTLKDKFYLFDAGYWLRYDLNPKKEILFQIDWLAGEQSPLIKSIKLQNPQTKMQTSVQLGDKKAFEGAMHISGIDWSDAQVLGHQSGRLFQNGYRLRKEAVQGGTRHNVYFTAMLPNRQFSDYFDVPTHQLVIRYKDRAPGDFDIKIQAINEGNVLSFVPLRGGIIHTVGDQQWKTAYIQVRPQDLGWYVGPDYQQYEVDQIQRIANSTNDWFFYQYAQKQRDYLEAKNNPKTNIVKSTLLNKPYLKATDPKNPLHIFRLPITQAIKKLSDELSVGAHNDHEKILRFMDYIGQFRIGTATDASPESTIEERVGACGSFTNTLLALAAAQNIQGRVISLLNYPKNDGHALAEVLINRKWHVYDPTFSAFYSSNKDHVLSFSEIQNKCKVNTKLVHLNARVFRPGIQLYTGCPIFIKASPSGVIDPNHKLFFPLQLNYGHQNKIEKKDFGPKYQGADFIGIAATNQSQEWHLSNLSIGTKYEFIMKPDVIGGDMTENELSFLVNASIINGKLIGNFQHMFDFSKPQPSPWVIQFVAEKTEVILNVSHPYQGPKYRYMYLDSYELKKLNS